jgi:hypothetical protein
MMPTQSWHLAAFTLLSLSASAVGGCSSTTRYENEDPSSSPAPSTGQSLDVTGTWRVCDSLAQSGLPSGDSFVLPGGEVVDIEVQQSVAVAYLLDADGGTGQELLSGDLDETSRIWTADLFTYDDEGDQSMTYPSAVRLTFSPDATRFNGIVDADDEHGTDWYGGREDGIFTCGPIARASP